MGEEVEVSPTLPIASALDSFISSVDALAETFPVTQKAINESLAQLVLDGMTNITKLFGEYMEFHDSDIGNKFKELVVNNEIKSRRKIDKKKWDKMLNKLFEDLSWMKDYDQRLPSIGAYFEITQKKIQKLTLANKLIAQSFVITLISQFDIFLNKLIRALFLMKPEVLNASEKNISFSQLQSFRTLDDARDFIIEKEIDIIMRKSHADQIEWLEKQYNIKLIQELSSWPNFVEVTEHRNLFVHTGGIVSNQYIGACNKYNVKFTESIQLGQELDVSSDHFHQAYECIIETGIKIAHLLWRRVHPKALEADSNLNGICYQFLLAERYSLTANILDFALEKIKKHSNDQMRRIFIVNRAQSYKWKGHEEKAKSIMSEVDWSASNDTFRLAEAIIMDDFNKANHLVRKMGVSGDLEESNYREWPLFKEYKKNEEFLKTFEEIFGEPFHLYTEENLFATVDWLHNVKIPQENDEEIS